MKPTPGAYRGLFIKALSAYSENTELTPEDRELVQHYITLLHDTNYKFGKVTQGEKIYSPGELFLGT